MAAAAAPNGSSRANRQSIENPAKAAGFRRLFDFGVPVR
jgi:hypothetical protein